MRFESIEDLVALYDRRRASGGKKSGGPYELARTAKLEVGVYELNHPAAPILNGVFSTAVCIGHSTHALGLRGELESNSPYPYEVIGARKATDWEGAAELISSLNSSMRARFVSGPKPLWYLIRSESERAEIIDLFDEIAKRGRGRRHLSRAISHHEPDIDVDWLHQRLSLSAKSNRHQQDNIRLRYISYRMRQLILSAYVDRIPTFCESVTKRSGDGARTYLDTEKLYRALPESPKAEIKNFHKCLVLIGKSAPEVVDELIGNLSPFSARAIAKELSINGQMTPQDLLREASSEELVQACEKSAEKRRGRADKIAQNECVRDIRRIWRSVAGPRGNCITYSASNASGDCYDLIRGLNEQLGVDGFLPIEPLTEAE